LRFFPSRVNIGSPQRSAAGSFLSIVARLIRGYGGDVGRYSGAALLVFRLAGIINGSAPWGGCRTFVRLRASFFGKETGDKEKV